MFQRFRAARKLRKADLAAKRIVSFVAPCLFQAADANGGLDPKVQDDEFVLAYIYGMLASYIETDNVTDQEEQGYVVSQVFENLFPGRGKRLTEVCSSRLDADDTTFMTYVQQGYFEMRQTFSSGGQQILTGLLEHVSENYG